MVGFNDEEEVVLSWKNLQLTWTLPHCFRLDIRWSEHTVSRWVAPYVPLCGHCAVWKWKSFRSPYHSMNAWWIVYGPHGPPALIQVLPLQRGVGTPLNRMKQSGTVSMRARAFFLILKHWQGCQWFVSGCARLENLPDKLLELGLLSPHTKRSQKDHVFSLIPKANVRCRFILSACTDKLRRTNTNTHTHTHTNMHRHTYTHTCTHT